MSHVFLCQPSYNGQIHAESADAFNQAGGPGIKVTPARANGSLLPQIFNMLWAQCVSTMAEHGYTHFGMIHADVVPQGNDWLPVLLREMDQAGADVISAVIPIKDGSGLTSTAVEFFRKSAVRNITRLGVSQCQTLPTTFGVESLPRDFLAHRSSGAESKLLLNTGLMLVKLGKPQAMMFTPFNVYCQINWQASSTRIITESEDWHFSRQCHTRCLKLVATTAVEVIHLGSRGWSSHADHPCCPDTEHPAVSLMDLK